MVYDMVFEIGPVDPIIYRRNSFFITLSFCSDLWSNYPDVKCNTFYCFLPVQKKAGILIFPKSSCFFLYFYFLPSMASISMISSRTLQNSISWCPSFHARMPCQVAFWRYLTKMWKVAQMPLCSISCWYSTLFSCNFSIARFSGLNSRRTTEDSGKRMLS